jgi:hypothetical protein
MKAILGSIWVDWVFKISSFMPIVFVGSFFPVKSKQRSAGKLCTSSVYTHTQIYNPKLPTLEECVIHLLVLKVQWVKNSHLLQDLSEVSVWELLAIFI